MKIFALSLVFLFGFSSCVSLPQDVKIAPIVKEKEPKKETKKEQEKEEKVEKESEEKTKSGATASGTKLESNKTNQEEAVSSQTGVELKSGSGSEVSSETGELST